MMWMQFAFLTPKDDDATRRLYNKIFISTDAPRVIFSRSLPMSLADRNKTTPQRVDMKFVFMAGVGQVCKSDIDGTL